MQIQKLSYINNKFTSLQALHQCYNQLQTFQNNALNNNLLNQKIQYNIFNLQKQNNSKNVQKFSKKLSKNFNTSHNANIQNALMSIRQHQDLLHKKIKRKRDPYGIQAMNDIDEILELQRNRKLDLTLNDYIFAFLRITELTPTPYFNTIYGLSELLENIKQELRKREEEDPIIGRLALTFKRANYFEDLKLWINLADLILGDMFDPESEEIYAAIQGFYHLQRKVEEEWQLDVVKQVYDKLVKYAVLHLKKREYNLRTLCVLTKYMVQNRITDQDLYFEIEYVLKSHLQLISMNLGPYLLENKSEPITLASYERRNNQSSLLLEEFSYFGYYFATVGYHSEMLFHFLQAFILESLKYKDRFPAMKEKRLQEIQEQQERRNNLKQEIKELERRIKEYDIQQYESIEMLEFELEDLKKQQDLYNEEEELQELVWPLDINGKVAAQLLQFFNFSHNQNIALQIDPKLIEWFLQTITQKNKEFSVENLYHIHKAMHQLQIEEEDKFIGLMQEKLYKYQYKEEDIFHMITLEHIKDYIDIRAAQEHDGDFQKIDQKVYQFLDTMGEFRMKQFDSFSVQLFTQMLDQEQIMNEFPKFLFNMSQYVLDNEKMYDFEEVCYFCTVCIKNQHHVQESNATEFDANVNLIKELIKATTYRRGFKMEMQSNFHELLQHVDLAEFFSGGEF